VRRFRYVLWPFGLAFGVAAEWIARPELIGLDAVTGFALVFLGLSAWSRRPRTAVGPIMAASGFTWFLGTFWSPALYLHRGPLTHLMLSFPGARLSSRREQVAVAAVYVYAAVYPVAANDYATVAFALVLVTVSASSYLVAGGPQRRARLSALVAATVFGVVLMEGAAVRLAGAGTGRAELGVYDIVVFVIAAGLFADLLWGRWSQATVTGLVVDLGEPSVAGTLRDRLARALGDPLLEVGYWFPEQGRYLQESGEPIELPAEGERMVTTIDEGETRVAVLVHDAFALDDPSLGSAVASATRLAVSNASLQVEVRARVAEVEESRRRIVEAGDEQRRRLGLELRDSAEQRLARVGELISDLEPELAGQLARVRTELRTLARGIHPTTLTQDGLAAAVQELAGRSAVPVELVAPTQRYAPSVEAVAYFVCSEALTNVAKYSHASRVTIRIATEDSRLLVEVIDDGVGDARMSGGSGLRGLRDRVESLGGRFRVDSPPGHGTSLRAELPLG
jgi:signal transduction histidine kinase